MNNYAVPGRIVDDINKDISSPTPSRWQAVLDLVLERNLRGTRLTHNSHSGPLYVQKPFYPEGNDLAHIYLLHPPGGLVSGDCLNINIQIKNEAKLLVTTPGASRVYRARVDKALQSQRNHITVNDGASLEWLPLETIIFPGAHAKLETQIDLHSNSKLITWEITSLGLPANNQVFNFGSLQQRITINYQGRPVLIENLHLGESNHFVYGAKAGMQNYPISGLFIAGPFLKNGDNNLDISALKASVEIFDAVESKHLVALSEVGEFLVARYLGSCSEQARIVFTHLWERLRPQILNRPSCKPRIWYT